MQVPDEGTKGIFEACTFRFTQRGKNPKVQNVEVIRTHEVVKAGVISVPIGRMDLIEGYSIDDRRICEHVPFPEPLKPLRDDQLELYDAADDSCFINAKPGWGKTFMALHLAKKLGCKTLVVTHTAMLRDQWVKEVQKLFGITPGIIGAGKIDIEDHCIVIGNVQTVHKFIPEIAKEFGTLIIDEAHHTPATTFSSIVDKSHARYKIALSGTRERSDGKHEMFDSYFGPKVFVPKVANTVNPVIRLVDSNIFVPPGMAYAEKVNQISYDFEYQLLIAAIAVDQMEKGHKVLVVGDRVEFLEKVNELIGESSILIIGKSAAEDRDNLEKYIEDGTKSCVVGTGSIFKEGISVNLLSSLILTIPTDNTVILEQVIGRIMRKHPKKTLQPEVIDMQFHGSEKRKNTARLQFYASLGWRVCS